MSTFAYGRIIKSRGRPSQRAIRTADTEATGQDENKLIAALAAIVPVELIAGHALILAATTTTSADGVTTINPDGKTALMVSLPLLVAATLVVFLIARGLSDWKGVDTVRLFIAPFAFLAWTALIGTSALTPWVAGINKFALVVAAVVGGIILAAISAKVSPPTDGT